MKYRVRNTNTAEGLLVLGAWFMLHAPLSAYGAGTIEIFDTPNQGLTFIGLANKLAVVADTVIPFLVGVAVVAILWGIYKYIVSGGDTERIAEGRKTVIYGIIALFVMLGFWGLVIAIKTSLFG